MSIVTLPVTDAWAFSFQSSHETEPYRLFLYVPEGPAPEGGWPLLCLTDGNATFGLAVGAMRAQACDRRGANIAEGVILAIGYPTNQAYDSLRRSWNLTPPPGARYPSSDDDGPVIRTGGGLPFLDAIEDEILPWVSQRVPIDATRRTLFGHSFGGLLTLLCLFRKAGLFRTYVAASPSLYWEDRALEPFANAFFAGAMTGVTADVHLSAGQYEGTVLAPFFVGGPDEAQRVAYQARIQKIVLARALVDRINGAAQPRLHATFEEFAGENHMSALSVATSRAVYAAFHLPPRRPIDWGANS